MQRSINLDGPWDVKFKTFNNQFLIEVSVYDPEKPEGKDLIETRVIDYGEYEDRKFLGRISFWAYSKGYEVLTRVVEKS